MKKTRKLLIILTGIILILLTSNVYAISNLNDYDPSRPTTAEAQSFLDKAAPILGFIQNIGIMVAVIALALIGLKYMFSSVEGKAEYKKTMWPLVFGCFMLMGVSLILGIIEDIIT